MALFLKTIITERSSLSKKSKITNSYKNLIRVHLLSDVIVKGMMKAFSKDEIQEIFLAKLKANPEFHNTDLHWKLSMILRKKSSLKGEAGDLIKDCIE